MCIAAAAYKWWKQKKLTNKNFQAKKISAKCFLKGNFVWGTIIFLSICTCIKFYNYWVNDCKLDLGYIQVIFCCIHYINKQNTMDIPRQQIIKCQHMLNVLSVQIFLSCFMIIGFTAPIAEEGSSFRLNILTFSDNII